MFKRLVWVLLIVLLAASVQAAVDAEIYSVLETSEMAPVIIHLHDDLVVGEDHYVEVAAQRKVDQTFFLADYDFPVKGQYSVIHGIAADVTAEDLALLEKDYRVAYVESDGVLRLFVNDTTDLVNADVAHGYLLDGLSLTGFGQSVCVIDSGVNASVPSLAGAVVHEQCFCSVTDYGNGGCCPNNASTDSSALDDDVSSAGGHGTRVSSIISGNSTLEGVAPDTQLVVVKAFDKDRTALVSDTVQAIDYCVANQSKFNFAAISMSFGTALLYGSACDATSSYASSLAAAVALNITPVAATGNSGSSTGISDPACVSDAVSVASSTKTLGVSSFSNRNSITDLIAPGSSIVSSARSGVDTASSGTSYSVPAVSALVALLQQYKVHEQGFAMTPVAVRDALVNTAFDIIDGPLTLKHPDLYAALLSVDVAAPSLFVDSPLASGLYVSNDSLELLFGASDVFFDSAWYNFNDGLNVSIVENVSLGLPEGQWNLTVFANDSAGNVALVTRSFMINLTAGPDVALVSPADGAAFGVGDVLFNCSASDDGLSNMTLYHNATGDFVANGTVTLSGLDDSASFASSFVDGRYHWNCLAYDDTAFSAYAPANRTFVVDTGAPVVGLEGPVNGFVDTDGGVVFTYNVTDAYSSVSLCSLFVNDVYDQNSSSFGTFSKTLSNGAYSWFVSCTDALGHSANSTVLNLTVAIPAPSSSSSSSSGGGGGGGGSSTSSSRVQSGDVPSDTPVVSEDVAAVVEESPTVELLEEESGMEGVTGEVVVEVNGLPWWGYSLILLVLVVLGGLGYYYRDWFVALWRKWFGKKNDGFAL